MQISPGVSGELKTSQSDFPYWENGQKVRKKKEGIHNYVNKHGMLGKIVVESRPAKL